MANQEHSAKRNTKHAFVRRDDAPLLPPPATEAGAYHMAKDMGPGHVICTILCDSGQRYQSKIWNPAFLREKKLPVPAWLEGEE